MLAAGLLALQAFVAGLATAQAAVMLTPDATGLAMICHGGGAPASDTGDTGSAPDPSKEWHACCEACAASAGPAMLPPLWEVPSVERVGGAVALPWRAALLLIGSRAVRAGLSQAPPGLD